MQSKLLRFGLAVLAGFCVQAGIGQAQAFDWLASNDVGVDDLVNIRFGDVAVPDSVRIDYDVWPVLALIETSGLIGTDSAFEAALGQLLLEKFLQAGLGGGIAASAGMARWALVSADEDVLFEFRHSVLKYLKFFNH